MMPFVMMAFMTMMMTVMMTTMTMISPRPRELPPAHDRVGLGSGLPPPTAAHQLQPSSSLLLLPRLSPPPSSLSPPDAHPSSFSLLPPACRPPTQTSACDPRHGPLHTALSNAEPRHCAMSETRGRTPSTESTTATAANSCQELGERSVVRSQDGPMALSINDTRARECEPAQHVPSSPTRKRWCFLKETLHMDREFTACAPRHTDQWLFSSPPSLSSLVFVPTFPLLSEASGSRTAASSVWGQPGHVPLIPLDGMTASDSMTFRSSTPVACALAQVAVRCAACAKASEAEGVLEKWRWAKAIASVRSTSSARRIRSGITSTSSSST
mmetsp:Transcript_1954/g.4550  ORF Transcript_1954/g.4550 Transcript_1954/m.4550 type:complete len:327 (+) Transcript_1954:3-983(+)